MPISNLFCFFSRKNKRKNKGKYIVILQSIYFLLQSSTQKKKKGVHKRPNMNSK